MSSGPAAPACVREQEGIATLDQLVAGGMTVDQVRAELDAGRWQRVHRATYAAFSGPLPWPAQIWAGLLACGRGAALSHETAAECDGLTDGATSSVVHVTLPVGRRVVAPEGVHVHYLHRLATARHPSRRPTRLRVEDTVLGLTDAARCAGEALDWIFRAYQRRLTTPDRLLAAMADRPKMRWRQALEAALKDIRDGTHSELERRYKYRVERAHGLSSADRQVPAELDGRRAWRDVEHRRYATLVELDGRRGHEGDGRLRDMRRDNAAVVVGKNTLRFGWFDVEDGACLAAQQLAVVLRRNGWQGAPRRCGIECTVQWPPGELAGPIAAVSSP